MYFVKPETLDILAEQILIAAASVEDGTGLLACHRPDPSRAPEAVRLALNEIFGGGQNYQVLGSWPRPEQLVPLKSPFIA